MVVYSEWLKVPGSCRHSLNPFCFIHFFLKDFIFKLSPKQCGVQTHNAEIKSHIAEDCRTADMVMPSLEGIICHSETLFLVPEFFWHDPIGPS